MDAAHTPGYDSGSPAKKLGPWGSGTQGRVLSPDTLDDLLEEWEEWREEALARDIFGDDEDVGYYDDDSGMCTADGGFWPEAFEAEEALDRVLYTVQDFVTLRARLMAMQLGRYFRRAWHYL